MVQNKTIKIKSARVNNLKSVNLELPLNHFIVFTGLSGSGKSSLAFDTLYAEGQRRYVESLSAYARQFLGRMHKPEVDYIKGIPPAIAIEQKVNTRNPRSTVGTSTEIYDYIKLLYARIGETISPVSGKLVKRHTVSHVVDWICKKKEGTRFYLLCRIILPEGRDLVKQLEMFQQQGFSRIMAGGKVLRIDEALFSDYIRSDEDFYLVVDRLAVNQDEDNLSRMADSVQTAFYEGHGECFIRFENSEELVHFSNRFEADGIEFEEPSTDMFSFNNPLGACPRCEGYGKIIGIDPDLVIPDKSLSVFEEAVACWKGEKMSQWKDQLIYNADKFDFPIHRPFYELNEKEKELLWKGNRYFEGLDDFFAMLENESYKIQYRIMLSRYRGKTICPVCHGARLKPEASYVKVGGKSVDQLVLLQIKELQVFFSELKLDAHKQKIAKRILTEIQNRINYLMNVGLSYLTLNRLSSTLSGGESQRINLATSLGSSLVGSLYILDEPSIGLHARDTLQLISVLKNLQRLGNTVLIVEHDEEIIRAADTLVDIGPDAGVHGGEILYCGPASKIFDCKESYTAKYLSGELKIEAPKNKRPWNNSIRINGARQNNLKNITVDFPLNTLTVVSGVSGSGKSTLVKEILYPAVKRELGISNQKPGDCDTISGDFQMIDDIEYVDQNPIGRSSRSNPVTYLKAFDDIRKLFAEQQASKINGFKASHFSFNIDGGRCDECQGEGEITVEMQFMADVKLLCESCHGRRYKDEVLEVRYRGKNIYDILEMTVSEAIEFFSKGTKRLAHKIVEKLQPLQDVGLAYVKLGQSSSTLSGGESQRVKLASFLANEKSNKHLLFIFDEPTTGLHFHDVRVLLKALNALIDRGHSVILIEHNTDVIRSADWVIDLGPEGGDEGGKVLFAGIPDDLAQCEQSYTGKYL